ncbi:MAG TPA: sigma factor [Blastocatellia bacterium]|nr:sigma factor [Blastocatellia bacterium]
MYEKYSVQVYYLAPGELGSPHDAEEARAETFLRVIRAIRQGQLHSPEALASFLLTTAYHVVQEMV